MATSLTTDEAQLLDHYRRMKRFAEFRMEVFGSFVNGRRHVQVRPAPYYHLDVPATDTKAAFDAID